MTGRRLSSSSSGGGGTAGGGGGVTGVDLSDPKQLAEFAKYGHRHQVARSLTTNSQRLSLG